MHPLEFRQLAKVQWTFAIGEFPIGESLIGEIPISQMEKMMVKKKLVQKIWKNDKVEKRKIELYKHVPLIFFNFNLCSFFVLLRRLKLIK